MPKFDTIQENTKVPFNMIEADLDLNSRKQYKGIEDLADSIKAQGLITPLTVMKNGGDKYKLISGFRRYHALKSLKTGSAEVSVTFREFESDQVLHMANLVENTARADMCDADLAERITQLTEGTYQRVLHPTAEGEEEAPAEKVDRKTICEHTGLSRSHVDNLIRAHKNLCDGVKRHWRSKEIPLSKALEWAALKDDEGKVDEDAQVEAFTEWKTEKEAEKAERAANGGKKRRASKASEASEETWGSDTPRVRTKAEFEEELEKLQTKLSEEKLRGTELEVTKAKEKTLRWALGLISRF